MGLTYTDITLKNAFDVANVQHGIIKERDTRMVNVRALVDTGAGTLVITETVRQKLGLDVRGLRKATLGNNAKEVCKITEPVEVHWKDRSMTCQPIVIGGSGDVLLGAIPLEDMDLVVNPGKQELYGAHGDEVVCYVK
jgi:clan AA aspartic protease